MCAPRDHVGVEAAVAPDYDALLVTPSSDYPASLVARDVATLSHLRGFRTVLVEGTHDAAELIAALLRGESVTMHNSAGSVTAVTNRPAPPRPLAIFYGQRDEWTKLPSRDDAPSS